MAIPSTAMKIRRGEGEECLRLTPISVCPVEISGRPTNPTFVSSFISRIFDFTWPNYYMVKTEACLPTRERCGAVSLIRREEQRQFGLVPCTGLALKLMLPRENVVLEQCRSKVRKVWASAHHQSRFCCRTPFP